MARIGTPYATEHLKSQFSKSKMADSRHFEKSKNRHISETNLSILMKFRRVTQIWSLKRTSC